MIRWTLAGLAIVGSLWAASGVVAQSLGRYQAMLIQVGDPTAKVYPKVFIFDTQNGDTWLWYQEAGGESSAAKGAPTGGVRSSVLYQGKLRQGRKMGEVLFTHAAPGMR